MIADRLRRYPKTTRNASSAALIVIGVLALCNWVLTPHLGYLHAMQKYGAVVENVVQEKGRIADGLEAKVGQWHARQRELAELEDGVFTADQAKTFARSLLPLVEETGCRVVLADFAGGGKTTRVEDPNQTVVIEISHLNLDALGQPDQVSALLERLRDNRPRVSLDSCQLDFLDGGSGQVECHLAVTLYAVGDRKAPGGQ
jgi:hypothetical protein